jgi:hypothetical protein
MITSPTAVRTARRNRVHRVERFVRRIQTESFQPDPDAIANFEVALECLERADYPDGEDAMIWGEYGFAPRFPRPAESHRRLASSLSASSGCGRRSSGTSVEVRRDRPPERAKRRCPAAMQPLASAESRLHFPLAIAEGRIARLPGPGGAYLLGT